MADKKKHPLWPIFKAFQDYDDKRNSDLDQTIHEVEDHLGAEKRRDRRKRAKGKILKQILDDNQRDDTT